MVCNDSCPKGPHFSVFKHWTTPKGVDVIVSARRLVTLQKLAEVVKQPPEPFREQIDHIRSLAIIHANARTEQTEQDLTAAKRKLVSFTPAGHFKKGRKRTDEVTFTGCTSLDIDGITPTNDDPHLVNVKAPLLFNLPGCRIVFTSPSGKGVKVLLGLDPIPTTNTEFETATAQVRMIAQQILDKVRVVANVDRLLDAQRICYMSYDPQPGIELDVDAQDFKWNPGLVSELPTSTGTTSDIDPIDAAARSVEWMEEIMKLGHGDNRMAQAIRCASYMSHHGVLRAHEKMLIDAICKSGISIPEAERVCSNAYGYAADVRQLTLEEIVK